MTEVWQNPGDPRQKSQERGGSQSCSLHRYGCTQQTPRALSRSLEETQPSTDRVDTSRWVGLRRVGRGRGEVSVSDT